MWRGRPEDSERLISARGRALLLILPILALLGGVGVGIFLVTGQVHQLKQQLQVSKQQADQLLLDNQDLTTRIGRLQADREKVDGQLASFRTQVASTATELEQARTNLKTLQERYDRLSEERIQLHDQLAQVTKARMSAEQEAQGVKQEKAELQRAAGRVQQRLDLLDRDYQRLAEQLAHRRSMAAAGVEVVTTIDPELSASTSSADLAALEAPKPVELPPIVVRKDQTLRPSVQSGMGHAAMVNPSGPQAVQRAPMEPQGSQASRGAWVDQAKRAVVPMRGRLIEVDEANGFVIVNQGSEDGVRLGMFLDVTRGRELVGRVSVIRVRPHLVACDVVRAQTPRPLKVGDVAVQSGL